MPSVKHLGLLLIGLSIMIAMAAGVGAARPLSIDQCRLYGFAPRTHAYAVCRMNVRRYWTMGPCGRGDFAATHREYCHLNPPPFI